MIRFGTVVRFGLLAEKSFEMIVQLLWNFLESFFAISFKRLPSSCLKYFCALFLARLYFVRARVKFKRDWLFLSLLNKFRARVNSCLAIFIKPFFVDFLIKVCFSVTVCLAENIEGFIMKEIREIFHHIINGFV